MAQVLCARARPGSGQPALRGRGDRSVPRDESAARDACRRAARAHDRDQAVRRPPASTVSLVRRHWRTTVAAGFGVWLLLAAADAALWVAGTIDLHQSWWRTVTETTPPNLLNPDNVSLASMYAKWLGVEHAGCDAGNGVRARPAGWRRARVSPAPVRFVSGRARRKPAAPADSSAVAAGMGLRAAHRDSSHHLSRELQDLLPAPGAH